MATTKGEVRELVRRFAQAVAASGIRVDHVILYGSHARGGVHETSDINVAVVSPDLGRDPFEEALTLREIALRLDPHLVPEPYSREEYRTAAEGDFLHDEVLAKGEEVALS